MAAVKAEFNRSRYRGIILGKRGKTGQQHQAGKHYSGYFLHIRILHGLVNVCFSESRPLGYSIHMDGRLYKYALFYA